MAKKAHVDKLILLRLTSTSAEVPRLALKERGDPPELRTQQWPRAFPALQGSSAAQLTLVEDLHWDPCTQAWICTGIPSQPAAALFEHTLKCQSAASTLLLYVRQR